MHMPQQEHSDKVRTNKHRKFDSRACSFCSEGVSPDDALQPDSTPAQVEVLQAIKAAFVSRTALAIAVSPPRAPPSKHPNMTQDLIKVLQLFLSPHSQPLCIP
jgi:hypothetical protein